MRSGLRRGRTVWALCAFLALARAACPAFSAGSEAPTAILLVSRGEVSDPDFEDSTVLVMNNLGPAPVGIIVNRPTPVPVSRLFPDVKRLAHVPDKVYFGGPVQFEAVWFLFRASKKPAEAIQVCEGVYLSGDRELLMRLLRRERPMEGLRIFVGHAGWERGQLEGEIAQGDWTLKRVAPDAIFDRKSEHPWPAPRSNGPTT